MRHALVIALTAAAATAIAAATPATRLPADEVVRLSPADSPPQGQTIDVALTSTGSHPRVGIPTFVTTDTGATAQEIAATLADVLAYDLDFEREYYVIPRKTSASVPLHRHPTRCRSNAGPTSAPTTSCSAPCRSPAASSRSPSGWSA